MDKFFGNFTNIVPQVELDVGALAELDVSIGKFGESIVAEYTIASTAFAMPTTCLSFNEKSKSFGSPVPPPSPTSLSVGPSGFGTAAPVAKKGSAWRIRVGEGGILLSIWGAVAIIFIVWL